MILATFFNSSSHTLNSSTLKIRFFEFGLRLLIHTHSLPASQLDRQTDSQTFSLEAHVYSRQASRFELAFGYK